MGVVLPEVVAEAWGEAEKRNALGGFFSPLM